MSTRRDANIISGGLLVVCGSAVVVPYFPGVEHFLDVAFIYIGAVVVAVYIFLLVKDG